MNCCSSKEMVVVKSLLLERLNNIAKPPAHKASLSINKCPLFTLNNYQNRSEFNAQYYGDSKIDMPNVSPAELLLHYGVGSKESIYQKPPTKPAMKDCKFTISTELTFGQDFVKPNLSAKRIESSYPLRNEGLHGTFYTEGKKSEVSTKNIPFQVNVCKAPLSEPSDRIKTTASILTNKKQALKAPVDTRSSAIKLVTRP